MNSESRGVDAVSGSDDGTVIVPRPRGFCAGVVRAIDIVRIALQKFGPPVYVRKEIAHNRHLLDGLAEAGAIFVDELDQVPNGAVAVFSAHGVAPTVRAQAEKRRLRVIDATCPVAPKVPPKAVRCARGGYTVVRVGHHDHDGVIGTVGE